MSSPHSPGYLGFITVISLPKNLPVACLLTFRKMNHIKVISRYMLDLKSTTSSRLRPSLTMFATHLTLSALTAIVAFTASGQAAEIAVGKFVTIGKRALIVKRDLNLSYSMTACTEWLPCVNFDSTLAGNVLSVQFNGGNSPITFFSSTDCSAATGGVEFSVKRSGRTAVAMFCTLTTSDLERIARRRSSKLIRSHSASAESAAAAARHVPLSGATWI
ncbi:hypothetical protein B0H19DRAFT_1267577 [Mycena capillaripes]|nr:hypothetical protein B0H19DRAFT_1267577 [Mycena capillaripes]